MSSTQISVESFPKGPISNIPELAQVMTCCQLGDKPLSGQMVAQFTEAYIRHAAPVR